MARKPDRFDDLAGGLERAAAAIARLDTMLSGHPLAAAWLWRIRLEAVRRQAMADGLVIDPWHLAAAIDHLDTAIHTEPHPFVGDCKSKYSNCRVWGSIYRR